MLDENHNINTPILELSRFAQLIKLFSAFFQVAFSVYSSQQRCKLEPRGQVGSVQLIKLVPSFFKFFSSFFRFVQLIKLVLSFFKFFRRFSSLLQGFCKLRDRVAKLRDRVGK